VQEPSSVSSTNGVASSQIRQGLVVLRSSLLAANGNRTMTAGGACNTRQATLMRPDSHRGLPQPPPLHSPGRTANVLATLFVHCTQSDRGGACENKKDARVALRSPLWDACVQVDARRPDRRGHLVVHGAPAESASQELVHSLLQRATNRVFDGEDRLGLGLETAVHADSRKAAQRISDTLQSERKADDVLGHCLVACLARGRHAKAPSGIVARQEITGLGRAEHLEDFTPAGERLHAGAIWWENVAVELGRWVAHVIPQLRRIRGFACGCVSHMAHVLQKRCTMTSSVQRTHLPKRGAKH